MPRASKSPEAPPQPSPIELAKAVFEAAMKDSEIKRQRAAELAAQESQEAAEEQARIDAELAKQAEAERAEREEQRRKQEKRDRVRREAEAAAAAEREAHLAYLRATVEGSEGVRTLLDRASQAAAEAPAEDDMAGRASAKVREVLDIDVPPDLFNVYDAGSAELYLLGERLVVALDEWGGETLWVHVMRPDNYGDQRLVAQVAINTLADIEKVRRNHGAPDLFSREDS